jgi:nitroreductase
MSAEILESLSWRYATKKFDTKKTLKQDKLDLLIAAFNLTATSYGLQPCRLIVVKDQDLKEKMLPLCFNQSQIKDCDAVLVLCTTSISSSYIHDYFKRVETERGTPGETLKPFKDFLTDSFSKKTPEEIQSWARNQAYLIMGNLLTVCAVEKIDSCPMEGFNPKAMDDLLELGKVALESVLLLPVGYRAVDDFMASEKKVRLEKAEVVRILD